MKNLLSASLLIFAFLFLTSCGEKNPCEKGHSWKEATCTSARVCSVCNKTEGKALGHDWADATCEKAKHCQICEKTEGEALGHNYGEATITTETSCSKPGVKTFTCSICNATKTEDIPKKAHTPGEWEITVQPTATTKGKKVQKCSVCGESMQAEEFEKSAAEIKSDYVSNCSDYTYEEISRNPENYKGKYAHFKGEIIQSIESGDAYTFRVNITRGSYTWKDTIMVSYTKKEATESRLLEDDIVDMYGLLGGTYTYETVMGNEMTVPLFFAEYIDLN